MKLANWFLMGMCWLTLSWQNLVTAQDPQPAEDADVQPVTGLGQLIARDPQANSPVRLGIERYHVNVVLQPPVALVQIDQSFLNPYDRDQEGTFVFNLPEGAAVSRFAMYVTPDSLIEGELIDRSRASQVYETIVRGRKDPAILEQLGTNLFRMRVFPIFAKDTKRILLDFTVPLVAERGRYEFSLPMLNDLKAINDFQITGRIAAPLAVESLKIPDLPDLKTDQRPDGAVAFYAAGKKVQPPANLRIGYEQPKDLPPTARVYTTKSAGTPDVTEEYFVLTVPARLNPAGNQPSGPTDVMVLVDTSGSIDNLPVAAKVVRGIAQRLRPTDRIQLGCVDTAFRPLTRTWQTGTSDQFKNALKQLDAEFPQGASNLEPSIQQAVRHMDKTDGRRQAIVYVGDGLANLTTSRMHEFWTESFRQTGIPFGTVLTSNQTETHWIRSGSLVTGGRTFSLLAGEHVQRDLIAWVKDGLPSASQVEGVEVERVWSEDLFVDASWPVGRDLHIVGTRPRRPELTAVLKVAGQRIEIKPEASPSAADDVFIGRQWAQLKLQTMLDPIKTSNLTQSQRVTRLCQEWSLMSPYTAFLVLETEADYVRWNIPRALRRRYWTPPGAVIAEPTARHESAIPVVSDAVASARRLEQQQARMAKSRLSAIQKALDQKQDRVAYQLLQQTSPDISDVNKGAFNAISRQVRERLTWDDDWRKMGDQRRLFDRSIADTGKSPSFLLPIVSAQPGTEFVHRNPHYKQLTKRVDLTEGEFTLGNFVRELSLKSGVYLKIDRDILEAAGITLDTPVNTESLVGVTVDSALSHALRPHNLDYADEPGFIRISTIDELSNRLVTKIYPVSDLVRANEIPSIERLSNPLFDSANDARQHIEKKLKTQVEVNFVEQPISSAVTYLSQKLEIPIRLDWVTLEAAGITADLPVTETLSSVPAEVVLDEMLRPHNLTCLIQDDALMITTLDESSHRMETRIYSLDGLLAHHARTKPDWMRNFGFFGGWGGGLGGSGLGGGGFGGSGGGGMGGGGGGLSGVGAGDGGARGGAGVPAAGSAPPTEDTLDIGIIAPPTFSKSNDAVVLESDFEFGEDVIPAFYPESLPSEGALLHTVMAISDGWEASGTGNGTISVHRFSNSVAVRQTRGELRKIDQLFEGLQRQPLIPEMTPVRIASEEDEQASFNELMQVVIEETCGGWESLGDGRGEITSHEPTQSLVIRQTARAHREIEDVLVQLRRAKYLAAFGGQRSLSTDVGVAWSQLPKIAMTDWPVSKPDAPLKSDAARRQDALEEELLSVRKVSADFRQSWRYRSAAGTQHIQIARAGKRLEYQQPQRIMRTEGTLAAVAYPDLGLVEINYWGETARRSIDTDLPWLPHRSNAELADMFVVSKESQNETSLTLKLAAPDVADTYILAKFDKASGLPVEWSAFVRGELRYKLLIKPGSVVAQRASTPQDQKPALAEEWELLNSPEPSAVAELRAGWESWLIADATTQSGSPLEKLHKLLLANDVAAAQQLLTESLRQQPAQPMLSLLQAWIDERYLPKDKLPTDRQRTALEIVANSGRAGLIKQVDGYRFTSFGHAGVLRLFEQQPIDTMHPAIASHLCDQALLAGQSALGLKYLDRACVKDQDASVEARTEPGAPTLLLRRIELVAPLDADKAIALAADLPRGPDGWLWLARVGRVLGSSGHTVEAERLLSELIADPARSAQQRSALLVQKADGLKGIKRWKALVEATDILPEDDQQSNGYLTAIRDEHPDPASWKELVQCAKSRSLSLQLKKLQADQSENDAERIQLVKELAKEDLEEALVVEPYWVMRHLRGHDSDIVDYAYPLLQRRYQLDERSLAELVRALENLDRQVEAQRFRTNSSERRSDSNDAGFIKGGGGGGFF